MNRKINSNSSLLIILYSSLLIAISEVFFLKLSPQIYSIFNPLPFLFVGLCTKYKEFISSVLFSIIFLFILQNFISSEEILQKNAVIFHCFFSLIVTIFISLCHLVAKNKLSSTHLISTANLLFLMPFFLFYFLYYKNLDHENTKQYFFEIISQITQNDNQEKNQKINEISDILILILPSINSLVFFITFSLNFSLAKILVQKTNFFQILKVDFRNFRTPVWFSLIFLVCLFFSIIFDSSIKDFSINASILMSFCYLFEGFRSLNNIFNKIQLNRNLKFLIIFLLFIFLGYVLLLIILFLGFYENIKNIKKNKE
ncbi:MAG: DUF2232 domain-containing protein [Pseudomonadota bacterium]|nr:DUF2232 domain-containing protein [Pseudomonadota bacterium]